MGKGPESAIFRTMEPQNKERHIVEEDAAERVFATSALVWGVLTLILSLKFFIFLAFAWAVWAYLL